MPGGSGEESARNPYDEKTISSSQDHELARVLFNSKDKKNVIFAHYRNEQTFDSLRLASRDTPLTGSLYTGRKTLL